MRSQSDHHSKDRRNKALSTEVRSFDEHILSSGDSGAPAWGEDVHSSVMDALTIASRSYHNCEILLEMGLSSLQADQAESGRTDAHGAETPCGDGFRLDQRQRR